jgi:hypothetical protein
MPWLALLFPPLAVLSAAHDLYLRNQGELDRTVSVLHPFWAMAGAAVLLAALVRGAQARAPFRVALWAYYLGGFGFVLWGFLRALPHAHHLALWTLDTAAGAAVFAGAFAVAVGAASRRASPRSVEPLLAVLALVFGAWEVFLLASRLDRSPPPRPRDVAAEVGSWPRADRPNVYHLILDSFQDELFEASPPRGAGSSFDGFVRFHASAPGRATAQVLPTLFTGRDLAGLGQDERVREGLVGGSSILNDLRRAGYLTIGFVPRYLYQQHPSALDVTVYHDGNARRVDVRLLHRSLFRRLFISRVLPLAAVARLARGHALGFDAAFLRSAQGQRLSTYAAPIVSLSSLESLLEIEPALPGRGRYTLVHVLLPHSPYLLRSDCGHSAAALPTDLIQQTDCTLRMLGRFLDLLGRLGRLDSATVVVHGDHGAGEVWQDGRLVPDETAYARTLLLVKAEGAHGALRRAGEAARIADVAPTLLAVLGLPRERRFDGRVLEEALPRLPAGPLLSAGSGARR